MVDRDGWQVPLAYVGAEQEEAVARSAVGLADLSAFAKISLRGRGLADCTQTLLGDCQAATPRNVALLDAAGPVLACRLHQEHLLLLALTTNRVALNKKLDALHCGSSMVRHDTTSALAGFALLGPATEEVLRRLTALDVSAAALPPGWCAETGLATVQALLVRPPGLPLPGVLIYVAWDLAEFVWETLWELGLAWGLQPVGMEAGWKLLRVHEG